MNALLRFTVVVCLTLFATMIAPSCSGSGPGPTVVPDCAGSPTTQMAGAWSVTGEVLELDPTVSSVYVPTGLDDAALQLAFVQSESVPGGCGAAYAVSSSTLTTESPSGWPTTLVAFAVSTGEGTFLVDGLYYYSAGDVTVEARLEFSQAKRLAADVFTLTVPFEVYDGDQIISVVTDTRGVDDDEDGVVDNPEESDPEDELDTNAVLVCKGTLQLTVSRSPQAIASRADTTTVFTGSFVSEAAPGEFHGQVLVSQGNSRVDVQIQDLLMPGGIVRIPARMDAAGQFQSKLVAREAEITIRGTALEGAFDGCTMLLASKGETHSYEFRPLMK